MTITIVPNQIPAMTISLMAVYRAARTCAAAFKSAYPDCEEIIIEAKPTDADASASLSIPAFGYVAKLELFINSGMGETDFCQMVCTEMTLVSEAC